MLRIPPAGCDMTEVEEYCLPEDRYYDRKERLWAREKGLIE